MMKIKVLFSILGLFLYQKMSAQYELSNCIPKLDTLQGKAVLKTSEIMPEYPGGEIELVRFIAKNVKYDKDEGILQTKVFVTFIIDTTGVSRNPCIVRPYFDDHLTQLELSVIEVVKTMPALKPGQNNGQKVPMRYTIPLNIELN